MRWLAPPLSNLRRQRRETRGGLKTVLLSAYRLATWLAGPLIGLYLQRRKAKGREDPVRLPERLGHAGHPRPGGQAGVVPCGERWGGSLGVAAAGAL